MNKIYKSTGIFVTFMLFFANFMQNVRAMELPQASSSAPEVGIHMNYNPEDVGLYSSPQNAYASKGIKDGVIVSNDTKYEYMVSMNGGPLQPISPGKSLSLGISTGSFQLGLYDKDRSCVYLIEGNSIPVMAYEFYPKCLSSMDQLINISPDKCSQWFYITPINKEAMLNEMIAKWISILGPLPSGLEKNSGEFARYYNHYKPEFDQRTNNFYKFEGYQPGKCYEGWKKLFYNIYDDPKLISIWQNRERVKQIEEQRRQEQLRQEQLRQKQLRQEEIRSREIIRRVEEESKQRLIIQKKLEKEQRRQKEGQLNSFVESLVHNPARLMIFQELNPGADLANLELSIGGRIIIFNERIAKIKEALGLWHTQFGSWPWECSRFGYNEKREAFDNATGNRFAGVNGINLFYGTKNKILEDLLKE